MVINLIAAVTLLAAVADIPDRPSFIGVCVTLDRDRGSEIATSLTVRSVEADSPAERAKIAVGDRITAIAGQSVTLKDDLDLLLAFARLKAGEPVHLSVDRGGKQLLFTVSPLPMPAERVENLKNIVACHRRQTAFKLPFSAIASSQRR